MYFKAPRDNPKSTVFFVAIDDCDEMPCRIERGTNVSGIINWEAEYVVAETLYTTLYAKVAGVDVTFPGDAPNTEACTDMLCAQEDCSYSLPGEGVCPVYPGEAFAYKVSMPILLFYPTGFIIGQWTLTNPENGELVLCIEIDIEIV